MRNKKGFTLVELVIVIAVIAILAGVMIGTFASVVKKAKESAKMQEMTAQKQEQIANDIDQKLKNAEWLGWTDFEEKLADAVSKAMSGKEVGADKSKEVKAAVEEAVSAAFAKYAASLGQSNTGLTADQVKYIVETALSNKSYSGVTAEQVKAIINNATSGLSNLSKAQVQAIVDAAQAKNLTVAQVTAAVTNATKDMDLVTTTDLEKELEKAYDKINTAISAAAKDLKDTALTEADIEALLAKYVSNGKVKGDYTWYNANATTMAIDADATKAADQLVALSTMAKGGTSFAGKTIELPATETGKAIDLTKVDFDPIVDFDGILKGVKDKTTVTVDVDPVWNTAEGRNGKTMMNYFQTGNKWYKDAVAYGLVASLKESGVVEGLTVDLKVTMDNPGNQYTYFGGIVGFLDGGTIRDCKVTGSVKGYNRIGGVVGYAKAGTIERVNVDVTITACMYDDAKNDNKDNYKYAGYAVAGGIIGYESAGTVEINDCTVKAKLTRMLSNGTTEIPENLTDKKDKISSAMKGFVVGQLDAWKNTKETGYTNKNKDTFAEWPNGSATKLNLTKVTVNDATAPLSSDILKDADAAKNNFGSHDSSEFVNRITIN